jgi:hypothetical protein
VAAGAGRLADLPLTVEQGRDGTGGDSPPFRSPGGFRVLIEGGDCRSQVYRAADGSQVEELFGTARWEHNESGSFYVHTDPRCRTRIEAI